jgi:hypothetical protein
LFSIRVPIQRRATSHIVQTRNPARSLLHLTVTFTHMDFTSQAMCSPQLRLLQ